MRQVGHLLSYTKIHGQQNIKRFSWNLIFEYFLNICRENSSFIEMWIQQRVLYMKTIMHFDCISHFFLEWGMFQTKVLENIRTHLLSSVTFFFENCAVYEYVEKHSRARQATYDNMAHAHCMLNT